MSDPARGERLFPQRLVEDFVKQLNITHKACRLYPSTSDLPQVSAERAVAALKRLFDYEPVVVIDVDRQGLSIDRTVVFPNSESFAAFGREFYARRLCQVTFHPGAEVRDITSFMRVLATPPEDLFAQGGLGSVLWERGVSNISVAEVATQILDEDEEEDLAPGPDDAGATMEGAEVREIDDVLLAAGAGHPRDRRVLVRLMHDRRVMGDYLDRSLRAVEASNADASAIIKGLVHGIHGELPAEHEAALRSLSDAIGRLEPADRDALYRSRLLDEARKDESLATLVRMLGADEVLDVLLAHADDSPSSHHGLLRAIRNLAAVEARSRAGSVLDAARDKLSAAGFDQGTVASMLAAASPHKLGAVEPVDKTSPRPVETVLRLIGMTPDTSGLSASDESIRPLSEEAARGITDGEVLSALVTIATLEDRDAQFAQVMTLVEDGLGLLAETHEFDSAATAVETLSAAAERSDMDPERGERMLRAVRVLGRPEAIGDMLAALRVYKPDTPEYAACSRLLDLLGAASVDPLLDALADEQDMGARKVLVQRITRIAPSAIPALGARLSDPRWYFVRNVVAVLAGTRSPAALGYLTRTLRHADARVRRETIRGLAAFRTAPATGLLVGALADGDASNVQLAARALGRLHAEAAIGALEQVARGEGRGNRDAPARIEAIGALVEMRATSALPTLRRLAGPGGFFGRRKDRDVRAAAQSGVRALESGAREGGPA